MTIYIETSENKRANPGMKELVKLGDGKGVYADLNDTCFRLKLENERYIYLFGDVLINKGTETSQMF